MGNPADFLRHTMPPDGPVPNPNPALAPPAYTPILLYASTGARGLPPVDDAPATVRAGAAGAVVFVVVLLPAGADAFVVELAGFAGVVAAGFAVVVAGFAGAFVVAGAVFVFVVSFFAVLVCAWSAVGDNSAAKTEAASPKRRTVTSAEVSNMHHSVNRCDS
jgi:hypothetical protein